MPYWLRGLLASSAPALSAVVPIFTRVVLGFHRDRARQLELGKAESAAVIAIQRFGGSLNLHVHVHAVLILTRIQSREQLPENTAGKPCVSDGQCSYSLHLVCQEGTCQRPVYSKQGEACEGDNICAPGPRCRDEECIKVEVGDECDSVLDCGPMQRCRKESPGDRYGVCIEQVLPGGTCDSNSRDNECVHGLRCVENKCVPVSDSMCK